VQIISGVAGDSLLIRHGVRSPDLIRKAVRDSIFGIYQNISTGVLFFFARKPPIKFHKQKWGGGEFKRKALFSTLIEIFLPSESTS